MKETPLLTSQFRKALCYALELHSNQRRKGSGAPYASHLLAVASLVLDDGCGEQVAIAALLHDAIEDQGGKNTQAEIRKRFGPIVESLVVGCSDHLDGKKKPWKGCKRSFIRSLETADPEVLYIVAADKLHNALSILREYHQLGTALWQRFKGRREGTIWYYRTVTEVLNHRLPSSAVVAELQTTVSRLEVLV